jgi:hypothetical protein
LENLLWKILVGDKLGAMKLSARLLMAALVLSIGSITRNVSLDSARDKLLRGHQYGPVSQLPHRHGRNAFRFCIDMLRDSIGVLRTLFYQGESFRYTDAANRDGWA